jgi:glycosyltransferase involved in cell wall biosynthesis
MLIKVFMRIFNLNLKIRDNHLVSILMPAYNSGKTIAESIESVLEQTYQNWELIVINDGSSDNTVDIIKTFKDDRVILIEQKQCGVCCARNNGLRHSNGDWIAFLDSDDLWVEKKLEVQLNYLEKNDYKFSYSKSYSFAEDSNNVKKAFSFVNLGFEDKEEILIYDFIPTLTVMLHKSIINDVGIFDQELNSAEDWDLWIRVLQKYRVGFIDEYLTKYRVSNLGLSGNLYSHHIEEEKVFKKHISKYNKIIYKYRTWFCKKKKAIIALQKKDYYTFLKLLIQLCAIPRLLVGFILNKYAKRS